MSMSFNPADRINPSDFSEYHSWEFDQLGIHKHLRSVQNDIYSHVQEPIQNACDSNDTGKPNRIEIFVGANKYLGQPFLVVHDHGPRGITKDYDDIHAFISAMKATTEKDKRKDPLQRKGIGMFQYTNISPTVVITSTDGELIHRIPITIDPNNGKTAYGRVVSKGFSEKNCQEFGISEPGTRVSFLNSDPNAPKESLSVLKLRNILTERWALRLVRNRSLHIFVNGKQIHPPQWVIEHPPKWIQRMKGGANIWGNIWQDPKGNGSISVFQDGYKVTSKTWEVRQCLGYVECSAIHTNIGRTAIMEDNPEYVEFRERMLHEVKKFPLVTDQGIADKKQQRKVEELAIIALKDLLKKTSTLLGTSKGEAKTVTTGNRDGTTDIGYVVGDTPDPNRTIIERDFKGRDLNNPTHVTQDPDGKDRVKVKSYTKRARTQEMSVLNVIYFDLGPRRPLFNLFQDNRPPTLYINIANAEYAICQSITDNPRLNNLLVDVWLSEIVTQGNASNVMSDEVRMQLSDARVRVWKETKQYPILYDAARGSARGKKRREIDNAANRAIEEIIGNEQNQQSEPEQPGDRDSQL